jgi:hypothetical protein
MARRRASRLVKVQKGGLVIDNVWDGRGQVDPKNKGTSPVPLSGLARQIIDAVPIIDADQENSAIG